MAGPQRPARAAGGGCGLLPTAARVLSPPSRIPPLRCGRQPLRRPGRSGTPAAPAHMEDAARELLVYATIGLCKIWPGVQVNCLALRPQRAGPGRQEIGNRAPRRAEKRW